MFRDYVYVDSYINMTELQAACMVRDIQKARKLAHDCYGYWLVIEKMLRELSTSWHRRNTCVLEELQDMIPRYPKFLATQAQETVPMTSWGLMMTLRSMPMCDDMIRLAQPMHDKDRPDEVNALKDVVVRVLGEVALTEDKKSLDKERTYFGQNLREPERRDVWTTSKVVSTYQRLTSIPATAGYASGLRGQQ